MSRKPAGRLCALTAVVQARPGRSQKLSFVQPHGTQRVVTDLFYRQKGVVLRTPSLAERATDVPLLARLFLRRAAEGRANFLPDALNWLAGRGRPGNVRELRAAVECAPALAILGAAGTIVTAADLAFAVGDAPLPVGSVATIAPQSLEEEIAALERRRIVEAFSGPGTTTPIRRANWVCRASACSRRWTGWGCADLRAVTAPVSLASSGPPTDVSGAHSADA